MHWVLLAVIAAALLLASARYPKFAFATLGALIVLVVALYFFSEKRQSVAERRITADEVALSHVAMKKAYADSYAFSGRLENRSSEHTLSDVQVRIVMTDCPPQAAEDPTACTVIGDRTVWISREIPPGQARDFEESVFFSGARPKHEARWSHTVVATRTR